MRSKDDLRDQFRESLLAKQTAGVRMSKKISELLSFMEHIINKDLQSFSLLSLAICGAGSRNFNVSKHFDTAYSSCSPQEKVVYFVATVERLLERYTITEAMGCPEVMERCCDTSLRLVEDECGDEDIQVRPLKGIKLKGVVRIILRKFTLDCSHFQIDLSSYLLRKSKKEKDVFCFQTMSSQEPRTIRLEVQDGSQVKEQQLLRMGKHAFRHFIETLDSQTVTRPEIKLMRSKDQTETEPPIPTPSRPTEQSTSLRQAQPRLSEVKLKNNSEMALCSDENRKENRQENRKENKENGKEEEKSLLEQLVGNEVDVNQNQDIYEYLERRTEKARGQERTTQLHRNRLSLLLPHNFSLESLSAYSQFVAEVRMPERRLSIFYCKRLESFKVELTLSCPKQKVLECLCQVQRQTLWNRSLNQSHVKWVITSENASIVYRKQKSISELYRERDFLFIRYLFKKDDCHFIVDRSLEDPHFIPFQSIQRGNLHHSICSLQQTQDGVTMLMDFRVDHTGLLTAHQNKTMALSYLIEYAHLEEFIHNFKGTTNSHYDYNWEIQDAPYNNNQSFASISSAIFDEGLEDLQDGLSDEDSFYSIEDEPLRFEVTEKEQEKRRAKEIKEMKEMKEMRQEGEGEELGRERITLDAAGLAMLPSAYLSGCHVMVPLKGKEKRMKMEYENIMLKNDFVIAPKGGIVLVNETKAAAQNNVIKFIMNRIGKNLFSGKSVLSISLPVEIFDVDSNLQRFCSAMALAPDMLERRAAGSQDPLERFRHCIAFALTNSILYFGIDKPFNPILGETFQGFIDGCPVYAEQTSHHPPISSLLLVGRGYRVFANLEAKVYIHLNSAEGVNQGLYTIEFDNGDKVVFQTAPGEVIGLAVGDRKYRIKGKMTILDVKNRLFSVISFEDQAGLFSSKKWEMSDQMEGSIWKVSPGYIRNFFNSESKKEVEGPSKKEIESLLGSISGRWIQRLIIDGRTYYDINEVPHELVHYQFPLHSNSNYRADLLYRKMDNLARSQLEKEALQMAQRSDRKMRQQTNGALH